jgi:hypothetical protein
MLDQCFIAKLSRPLLFHLLKFFRESRLRDRESLQA